MAGNLVNDSSVNIVVLLTSLQLWTLNSYFQFPFAGLTCPYKAPLQYPSSLVEAYISQCCASTALGRAHWWPLKLYKMMGGQL